MRLLRQPDPRVTTLFASVGFVVMAAVRRDCLLCGEYSSWAELSGWALLVVGFWLSGGIETRFRSMAERLFRRDLISGLSISPSGFHAETEKLSNRLALTGALIFPGTLLSLHFLFGDGNPDMLKLTLESVAAIFVGIIAGRIVATGLLGYQLKRHSASIVVKPGHPDGAGGLKLVGDLYLYQAGLVMIPLGFFAFWLAIASASPPPTDASLASLPLDDAHLICTDRALMKPMGNPESLKRAAEQRAKIDQINRLWSLEWSGKFAMLLFAMLGIEIVAFFLPMNFFHGEMVKNAEAAKLEADKIGSEVLKLDERITQMSSSFGREEFLRKRAQLIADYAVLESSPRWPIDSRIRRNFTLGNGAIMIFPVIAKVPFIENLINEIIGKS